MIEKQRLLRDVTIKPTDKLISNGLGETFKSYQQFVKQMEEHDIFLMDWRFYNDGKAWLTKGEYKWITSRGTKKVKPIFWLSIWKDFFKVSFNFKEETRAGLLDLPLCEETKRMISQVEANGKKMKYIPVIFDVTNSGQLADIEIIAEYRKKNI